MRRSRAGFTLLELLVAVAMVGMLASGATLAFGRMLKVGRLNQGVDVLVGALREAQVRAFQDGNLWRVSVASGDGVLYLETATDSVGADRGCGSTGWGGTPVRRYELPNGVTLGPRRSGHCVVFGQAGRVVSRAPYVVPPDPTQTPVVIATPSRLVDGRRLAMADLQSTSFDPLDGLSGAITWYIADMPDLFVDLREPRYISTICIGLLSVFDEFGVGYPDHLNLVASTSASPASESEWSIPLLDAAGPPDPADGHRERSCVDVTVNREIRLLRVRISGVRPGTEYWAFDEIDIGPRFFTIQYSTDTKVVEINPTTGRVTSKNG